MTPREFAHCLAAILVLFVVLAFYPIISANFLILPMLFVFSIITIFVAVISKKIVANYYDATVEHEIWMWERYGFKPHYRIKPAVPGGIIFPIFFSVMSLGFIKIMAFLTYEARGLKSRAARAHGLYSFVEMTDWHHALIGAGGIAGLLLLSVIAYFIPISGFETLSKIAVYYAFWNMIPFSKFDGAQIFFGSRPLYIFVGIITLIFTLYALFLI